MHLQAAAQLEADNPEAALTLEMEARTLCKKADDTKGEAVLVQMIVGAHILKHSNAVEKLNMNAISSKEGLKLMRDVSRKATKAAKEALQLAKKADDKSLIGTALNHLARIHLINDKFDLAQKAKDDALDLFREIGDQHEECINTTLGAEILFKQHKGVPALNLANQALELARKIKDAVAGPLRAVEVAGLKQRRQKILDMLKGSELPQIVSDVFNAHAVGEDGCLDAEHGQQAFRAVYRRMNLPLAGDVEVFEPKCSGSVCGGHDRTWNSVEFLNIIRNELQRSALETRENERPLSVKEFMELSRTTNVSPQ